MCYSSYTYTIPAGTAVTWQWPTTTYIYSGSYGHTKCPNCGYCTCCQKAD